MFENLRLWLAKLNFSELDDADKAFRIASIYRIRGYYDPEDYEFAGDLPVEYYQILINDILEDIKYYCMTRDYENVSELLLNIYEIYGCYDPKNYSMVNNYFFPSDVLRPLFERVYEDYKVSFSDYTICRPYFTLKFFRFMSGHGMNFEEFNSMFYNACERQMR